MFSPSLLSMMWHTLQQTLKFDGNPISEPRRLSMTEIVNTLRELSHQCRERVADIPGVPMIGRSQSPSMGLRNYVTEPRFSKYSFLHGRVPVDALVDHFEHSYWDDDRREFLDLGSPLRASQIASSSTLTNCQKLLDKTATQTGRHLSIALIDRGRSATGSPNDFNGTLQHAVTSGVDLDSHAVEVLEVLLERLDHHGLLPRCEVYCALVAPPGRPIGLKCFEHDNCVELLDALKKLDRLLWTHTPKSQPVFANLSLGTHVGPHDGNSPLEDFIRSHFSVIANRYLHVAAGNDGLVGNSARTQVFANTPEFVRLRLGPTGCTEVLVELWWDALPNAKLIVDVELSRLGARLSPVPLTIDSTTAGATLQVAGMAPPAICSSLFHAACHGGRSCISLALSVGHAPDLSDVDIDLTLTSVSDIVVNSWIVVCADSRSVFVTGGIAGSIVVPATDPAVISVAGVTSSRRPWSWSSHGPTPSYGVSAAESPPYLAHVVAAGSTGSGDGTSFASPRACADTANVQSQGAAPWPDAKEAAKEVAAAVLGQAGPWNPRTGFGAL